MTTYDDFQNMSYMERDAVKRLDMSRCDCRRMYLKGILRSAGSLQEVQLSDTVLDPSIKVDCMDGCGDNPSGGTFVDDYGVICWWGEGNTRSHAYENRVALQTPFAKATDRERRAHLGLHEDVKIRIVRHKK